MATDHAIQFHFTDGKAKKKKKNVIQEQQRDEGEQGGKWVLGEFS